MSPSIASLLRICDVIGIGPAALFDSPQTDLVRVSERAPMNLGGDGLREYLLTSGNHRPLQVIESHIEPGGGSGAEPYTLPPAQAAVLYLLAGALEFQIDGETYTLAPGDALSFSPQEPHAWHNPADEPARALWAVLRDHSGAQRRDMTIRIPER